MIILLSYFNFSDVANFGCKKSNVLYWCWISFSLHYVWKNNIFNILPLNIKQTVLWEKNLSQSEFDSWSWLGVLDTTLYDKICQWLVAGWWFSPATLVSSTNKTNCHNITEILLKVVLYTITLNLTLGQMVNI